MYVFNLEKFLNIFQLINNLVEENKPPVAKVPKEKKVRLPVDSVVLDGSNSTDDVKITSYSWKKVR